jgi:hypothetical protein
MLFLGIYTTLLAYLLPFLGIYTTLLAYLLPFLTTHCPLPSHSKQSILPSYSAQLALCWRHVPPSSVTFSPQWSISLSPSRCPVWLASPQKGVVGWLCGWVGDVCVVNLSESFSLDLNLF